MKRPHEEGSSINNMIIFVLKPTLMLGMQVTREIINLLLTISHLLEATSSTDDHRKKKVVSCSSVESEY